ncbi:hypothetical protein SNE40_004397 [Patella caerulea]|uniref:Uncharacterized protein n=1 Tax=Patella caerulea TaxID=87958 RepID=A0AAN8K985_PATCE
MELGLDFEDADFLQNNRIQTSITSYNAKFCYPLWFDDAEEVENSSDKAEVYKFGGDNSFYNKNYPEAIKKYKICLDHLPNHHTPVWRDIKESMARCYILLNCYHDGLQIANELLESCEYVSLKRQSLSLLLDVQMSGEDNISDQVETLQRLIGLDASYAPHWYKLFLLYKEQSELSVPVESELHCDFSWHSKMVTCLIRTRLLRRALHNQSCEIVKKKNSKILDQIEVDLDKLGVNEETITTIKAWMFEIKQDDSEDNDTSSQTCAELLTGGKFEEKWFGWSTIKS